MTGRIERSCSACFIFVIEKFDVAPHVLDLLEVSRVFIGRSFCPLDRRILLYGCVRALGHDFCLRRECCTRQAVIKF